ncbi:hypothetical protein WJX81_001477 [Elliptochloris bilobata]|uniref:WD repeat-containing protein 44 n=1 Tax=Elliptochloris bilobata TaxID=381761 RepID=A0AAW1QIM4_9CHLO
MGWKLNLCLAAVGAYLLGYRPAPLSAGLQSVASLGYTLLPARTPSDGLTSAIRNVTSDYDQLTLLVKQFFTERSDPSAELQFRDFLTQKASRSNRKLEEVLDWVLCAYRVAFPFLVCLVVAKVASGRAEQSEEKLALEGQLRRSSSRHHSRHLGHTSSPNSSSLDTAVSLPRAASAQRLQQQADSPQARPKAEAAGPSISGDKDDGVGSINTARGDPRAGLARVSTDEEVLTITEAGTGKEYKVQKKYTIRDLTTGKLFVLDSAAPDSGSPVADSGPAAGAAPGNAPTAPGLARQVTDVQSGRGMTLDEFDQALGLHSALRSSRQQHQSGLRRNDSDSSTASGRAGAEAQRAEEPPARRKAASGWLKRRLFRGASAAGGGAADSDDSAASLSTIGSRALDSGSFSLAQDSTTASTSGRGKPVRVHAHRKLVKELTDLLLTQELAAHEGVVWTMKFSKNGKYLATAGQDTLGSDGGAANAAEGGECSEAVVLRPTPHRSYAGHEADILDVAWSRSQFLLSASMDKTVRLWHISMDDCLRVFRHTDFVTALDFHPIDDKFFVSGSIDGKVRVWNIPEQRVVDYADVHEMVTATAFAPDGRRAVVGTMKGRCRFYACEPSFRLEYQAQIDVKNRRGQGAARGRKITGLQFLPGDPSQLLITSNDSRIRLYDGYTMRTKYKGHHNRNTQIRSTFSTAGDFLVCGSDDGWAYVWPTDAPAAAGAGPGSGKRDKNNSYECFHAHNDIVTVAIFAPDAARRAVIAAPPRPVSPPPSRAANVADSLNRLALRGKMSSGEAADAAAAGEAAIASQRALGQVILAAGYSGAIRVFENLGVPQWM